MLDCSQGLVNSQNEFESKTVIMTTLESSDRTDQRETGREVGVTMCFASDSVTKSDPPVEVNNASETQSDRLDGATRVAWGATKKDLPWRCLVVAYLDAGSRLRIPSGLPCENKCWVCSLAM